MPGGRPKKMIDPEQAATFASRGLTIEQIAHCCGVSPTTLYERQVEYPELMEAIKRGRSSGIEQIANKLYENAMAGHIVAQIFYLKNRCPEEWQDRRDLTIETKVARSVGELSDDELDAIVGDDEPTSGNGLDADKPA